MVDFAFYFSFIYELPFAVQKDFRRGWRDVLKIRDALRWMCCTGFEERPLSSAKTNGHSPKNLTDQTRKGANTSPHIWYIANAQTKTQVESESSIKYARHNGLECLYYRAISESDMIDLNYLHIFWPQWCPQTCSQRLTPSATSFKTLSPSCNGIIAVKDLSPHSISDWIWTVPLNNKKGKGWMIWGDWARGESPMDSGHR